MKSKTLEKLAKKAGLVLIRSKGSHKQYGKPNKPVITIPVKNGSDMNSFTYKAILEQIVNY
jgi:predicted RNA binding protein YcfA (HicA-like mRNA interferase family)